MSKTADKKADAAAATEKPAANASADPAAALTDPPAEKAAGETQASAAADDEAVDEEAPAKQYVPRHDRVTLKLKVKIALGNGTREKGVVLGELTSAMGRTLDEALGAMQHPLAETRMDRQAGGRLAVVSTKPAEICGRNFPAGTHFCTIEPTPGVLPQELTNAINGYGKIV